MSEPLSLPSLNPSSQDGRPESNGLRYSYATEPQWDPLRAYWNVLVQRWHLVLLVFLVVVGIAAYVTFSATPLYTAHTILQIEPQNPTVMQIEEVQAPEAANGNYHQTQVVLLGSRGLAAKVITDLGLEQNPLFAGVNSGKPGVLDWLRSRFSKLFASEKARPISEEDGAVRVRSQTIDRYLSLLDISPVRGTRLVEIAFTTPGPQLSRDIANAHAAAFIHMNLNTRFNLTAEAQEFLEKKLSDLKTRVKQSEDALNVFRQQQNVVSLQGNENIIVARMVDLNQRLTEARAKRIEAESLYLMVKNKDVQNLAQVIDNPLIQGIKTQIGTLEAEAARLSATFESVYPPLVELNEQIRELRQRLDREVSIIARRIEGDYKAARAKEDALQAEATRQEGAALDLKVRGVDYVFLEGQLQADRALYESVLKRTNETNVSGDITMSNIQITDRAETPLSPSSPRKGMNLLGASFLGLFLGGGLAFFLQYLDSATIKTSQDVWQATALPTLGVVPHLRSLRQKAYGYGRLSKHSATSQLAHQGVNGNHTFTQELAISHPPFSIIAESYRSIRTGLLLSQAEKPPQVILLTSARPGDGKTVTALNLAIALAQSGHAVLIVDADMRKGRCHRLLGRENNRGLSNVLTGNLSLEDGVQPTAVEGLFLLSRGVLPPNPVELLDSGKMKETLDILRSRFAFILLDSPPVLGISDATVLSVLSDGVLFVVRGQETTTAVATLALEQLRSVRARLLGVVLNGVDLRTPDYAYYRYYSSYYGAAQEEAEESGKEA